MRKVNSQIDQIRYIKIQPKTIDLNTRLRGITEVYCVRLYLIYRNWAVTKTASFLVSLNSRRNIIDKRISGRRCDKVVTENDTVK